ncbi:MAG: hypothetical protein ABI843_01035 [Dokdonella sp.]
MTTPALAQNQENASSDAGLPLRFAQRAFAALIEETGAEGATNIGTFRSAQLRSAARRTLSALSADDQARLQRWLALQLVSHDLRGGSPLRNPLARVDSMLAANVGNSLARTREELSARAGGAVAA